MNTQTILFVALALCFSTACESTAPTGLASRYNVPFTDANGREFTLDDRLEPTACLGEAVDIGDAHPDFVAEWLVEQGLAVPGPYCYEDDPDCAFLHRAFLRAPDCL